jgi:hypothetical protein
MYSLNIHSAGRTVRFGQEFIRTLTPRLSSPYPVDIPTALPRLLAELNTMLYFIRLRG